MNASPSDPAPAPAPVQFTNGAAYENFMGRWSQRVGEVFLDWLAVPPGRRWLDVGCGNGAFTARLAARGPASIDGLDPSAAQIAFARARADLGAVPAAFAVGDAMDLPYPDATFDVAVMPLVVFFLTDPALGVAEMARVVAPGGVVAAYSWDMTGGGFPYAALTEELSAMGLVTGSIPSPEASRTEVMASLWRRAGLGDIATREISVERTYADFADYWRTVLDAPSAGAQLAALPMDARDALKARLAARLPADAQGRGITVTARANAIKAHRPA